MPRKLLNCLVFPLLLLLGNSSGNSASRAAGSAPEGSNPGPDVIAGNMADLYQDGAAGTQRGLAVGITTCNAGNVVVNFFAMPSTNHPAVAQDLYRMSGGSGNADRFEQIGQSWVKHTYGAKQANSCSFGCQPGGDFTHLGVGCSDTYFASQSAEQSDLGSRAWINPFTGIFPTTARDHTGHAHTATSHKILVESNDLNTTLNAGATYYAELLYVTSDEYAWCQAHPGECNMYNNASYRPYSVSGTTSFTFSEVGVTVRMTPAIYAWTGATINPIEPEPGTDGRAFIAYKVTGPVAGLYHYEYAIFNQNLDRGIQSFSVPLECAITLTNLGFHAPLNHPGFPNDGTQGSAGFSNVAWTSNQTPGAVSWSTETFAQNQNANAIRWGTLYNFRFDSDKPPIATSATIGFFKTGAPVTVAVLGPNACDGTPPPILPPGWNGKIAFQSQRGGNNFDIYTMDPDGSNLTNLTFSPGPVDQDPDWSPDGTKIVFTSTIDDPFNAEIYVMDADGANVTRLTNNPAADHGSVWSPDGTKIAFVTDRDGNDEVYVMDANGSNPINLTNNAANDGTYGICWSPDGGKIAFTSDRVDASHEIYVMDANGSNPVRLTDRVGDDLAPDWSPDGTKIAFSNVPDPDGLESDVYVMDADGSNQIDLTPDSSVADSDPVWSPDGTKMAFTRLFLSNLNSEIYVMDADGSNQINLTNHPVPDSRPDWQRLAPGPSPTPGVTPIPSPTPIPVATPTPTPTPPPGTPTPFPTPILPPAGNGKILFERGSSLVTDTNIYVMDADGANPVNLTNDSSWDHAAAWSPDGTKIAFVSNRDDANGEIYLMNADGSNPVRLTNNPAVEGGPSWSPDGSKIAFESNRGNNMDIYVMNPDGSNQTRLTTDLLDDTDAAWSPDGGKIAFTSTRAGHTDVYLMDANGGNQINLTNRSSSDSGPAWSPDGTKISFSSSRNGSGIFVMSPDGTNVIRLTQSGGNLIDGGASWSPDGTKISFHRALGGVGGNAEVFVMNADGSNQVNITNDPALDISPDWQRLALAPPPTPTPTPVPGAQATNLSTRMRVLTGDNIGIGGFIIAGSSSKHVLIRALGPSLSQSGVPNVLADPVLELHGPGAFVTVTNDNWRDDPVQEALIIATGIPPTNNLESAIEARLYPGAYTALVSGKNSTLGVGLIEVYDLNPEGSAKLADISTRAFVSTGNDIVIAGFVLGGDSADGSVIVRGIGPSLISSGVPNALANPTVELRDENGALLVANNDWEDDPAAAGEITAAGLAPTNPLESGIAAHLAPGLYTALLAGVNNGVGVGLVEVYDRGAP